MKSQPWNVYRLLLSIAFCGIVPVAGCAAKPPVSENQRVILPRTTSAYPLRQPEYPAVSRQRGDQGLVGVDVLVAEDGRVSDVRIAMSSGHDALDTATLKETPTWRFVPGQLNGKPAAMWSTFTITFSLYDKDHPMPDQNQALAEMRQRMDERRAELEARAAGASTP